MNHSPESERRSLPILAEGEWFREGSIGAVLRGTTLVAAGDVSLASAFPASCTLALETPLE